MEKNNLKSTIALILALIAIVCSVLLFIFNRPASGNQVKSNAKASENTVISIACVDTDTLYAKYDMVTDMMDELQKTEKKLNADFKNRAEKFKADYENYIKIGASLTLSEQKKKEAQLSETQKTLSELEKKYSEQLMKLRMDKNQEVNNKIFAFIEEYNKKNGNYSFVVSKARTSGVLYSPENADITAEIVAAINKDYHKTK